MEMNFTLKRLVYYAYINAIPGAPPPLTQGILMGEILSGRISTVRIPSQYISTTCKISQCMGILNRLKRFLSIQTKVLIYSSLVLSHLNFGILLWDGTLNMKNCLNYKKKLLEF